MSRPASYKAASLIPVLAYEAPRHLFLCDDRSIGFGFWCRPLWGADDGAEQRVRALLSEDWPAGTIIGFHLTASSNITPLLADVRRLRKTLTDPILKATLEERITHLTRGMDAPLAETETYVRSFELVVTVKLPIGDSFPQEADLEAGSTLRERAEEILRALPAFPRPMDADGFVTLMSSLVNRDPNASWRHWGGLKAHGDLLLSEQILDGSTDLRFDRRGAWAGDTRISLLSVKTYPETMLFGDTAFLIGDVVSGTRGLKSPFLLTVNVHFPETQKTKTQLTQMRQWGVHLTTPQLVRWLPTLATRAKDFDIIFLSMEAGHRPVQISTTLMIYSADERAAETAISNAVTYWGEQRFVLMQDHFICQALMVNCLPFGADRTAVKPLGRYRTMTVEHCSRVIPLFADWRGTGTPLTTIVSRNGQLMNVSPFDAAGGYNTVTAGTTGSGKSFFTNEMIVSHLAAGTTVWVIDIGASYRNLNELLGGEYIDFGPDKPIGMNPFALVHDYQEEGAMLEQIVIAMAAPTETLTDFQTRLLGKIMSELWDEHGPAMTVDHVARGLQEGRDDPRLRDLGDQLHPFTSRGRYGQHFHGPNTITFKSRFTVLELQHLKSQPELLRVILLMLIYQIQQSMFLSDRAVRKALFVDEAWDLLRDGDVARFLDHSYRRFRKYNASATIITQSLADLYENDVGRAIVENSSSLYLLRQQAASIDELIEKKRLKLSGFGAELLRSLSSRPGRFSEIYLITERGQGVGRLVVPPKTALLYSTDPRDTTAIARHRRRGLDLIAAIEAVLQERSLGSAA